MIMKKLLYIIVTTMFVTTFLQSCLKEDNDYFSETATQRLENTLNMYDSLFTSNPNGWHIQQFTPTTKDLMGIAYYSVFKKGVATVRTEEYMQDVANYIDSTAGYYSVKGDNGPVLSFETSNTYITWHADAMVGYPTGSGGDFEFDLIRTSADKDTIYAISKRKLLPVFMYRINKPLKEYMADYETLYNIILKKQLPQTIIAGKDTLSCLFYPNYRNLGIYYADKGSNTVTEHLHGYGVSPSKIRFYEDVTLPSGVTFNMFDYDAESNSFISTAKDVVIKETAPARLLVSGVPFYFRGYAANLGTTTIAQWKKAKAAIIAAGYGVRNLYYLGFQSNLATGTFGLMINLGRADPAFINFDYKIIDDNHIMMKKSASGSYINGTDFYAKGINYVSDLLAPVDTWKTYKVEYDNPASPYDIYVSEVSDPQNKYTLSKYTQKRPFDKDW
jgi:hypothetical protein